MQTRHLPRVLSFFDLSVLSSASMGPAYSLASTMGPVVASAGTAAPLALVALSAIMLCTAIAFASLSRVAPNAGSSYAWIRMAFGSHAGAYGAWLLILSNFFATMAIAVPAGTYTLALVAPSLAQSPGWAAVVGALWIAFSAVLLYVGIRPTAIVTFAALAFEMLVLAAAAIASWFHPAVHPHGVTNALPPLTFAGFAGAMTLGVWMSDGWEVSASTSEEAAGDADAPGRGGVTGLVLTTVVLVACMLAFLHLAPAAAIAGNADDSLAFIGGLLGRSWRLVIVAAVMISTLSTLWTTMLYLSRSVYAMGRDRVLPRMLGTLDRRDEPLWSLAVVAVLVTACELVTGFSKSAADQLTLVVNASSVFLGLLFVFSAAASVWYFRDTPSLGRVWVPLLGAVALLGVLGATIVLEDRTLQAYAWGGIILGIPFALWRGRRVAA